MSRSPRAARSRIWPRRTPSITGREVVPQGIEEHTVLVRLVRAQARQQLDAKPVQLAVGRQPAGQAAQPLHLYELVSPGEEENRVERVTNINGEAFFTLRLGSGALYSGGLVIKAGEAWRDCVFPAFPALEARSVVQDLATLNCREGRGAERDLPPADTVLRISNELASTRALSGEELARLPSDPAGLANHSLYGWEHLPRAEVDASQLAGLQRCFAQYRDRIGL